MDLLNEIAKVEHQIAVLVHIVRKQAKRIAELESQVENEPS